MEKGYCFWVDSLKNVRIAIVAIYSDTILISKHLKQDSGHCGGTHFMDDPNARTKEGSFMRCRVEISTSKTLIEMQVKLGLRSIVQVFL